MAEVEWDSSEELSSSEQPQEEPSEFLPGDPVTPLMDGWSVRDHHLFVEALRK